MSITDNPPETGTESPTPANADVSEARGQGQWAALGILRFCLAMIVVLEHLGALLTLPPGAHQIIDFGARAAVLCFFLISGYSIAASMERGSTKQYYLRRAARIYPVYLVGIAVAAVPYILPAAVKQSGIMITMQNQPNIWEFVQNLIFLQGITTTALETNGPIWSLGCEVVYYILAPLIKRLSPTAFAALVFVSAVVYLNRDGSSAHDIHLMSTLSLSWTWLAGFALRRWRGLYPWLPWVVAVVGSYLLGYFDRSLHASFLWLVSTVLCAYGENLRLPERIIRDGLSFGEISFPIYVIHYPLEWIMYAYQISNWLMTIAAILLAAGLVTFLLDIPLRKRLYFLIDGRLAPSVKTL
jgi:peptidoglycan/LPS O-acetylase OafA/YrhL